MTIGPSPDLPAGVAVECGQSELCTAAIWLRGWRALAIDLPLVWTMELSRFTDHLAEAQVDHCIRLVGCSGPRAWAEEQSRFASSVFVELDSEARALMEEARTALAA